MKTLLAVRHVPFEDLGAFAPWLAEAGYAIQYVDAPTADFSALTGLPADLLMVLGGPIGVNDAGDYPFIADELKFVEARMAAGRPLMGICLGGQFIAKALGARVYSGQRLELGWDALDLTVAGRRSCLRHLTAPVFHWHGEVFDLPEGAVRLASTGACPNQAFSYGRSTLALQFHPEVTARGLEQWYVAHTGDLRTEGVAPGALREAAGRHAGQMAGQARAMLTEWLQSI